MHLVRPCLRRSAFRNRSARLSLSLNKPSLGPPPVFRVNPPSLSLNKPPSLGPSPVWRRIGPPPVWGRLAPPPVSRRLRRRPTNCFWIGGERRCLEPASPVGCVVDRAWKGNEWRSLEPM